MSYLVTTVPKLVEVLMGSDGDISQRPALATQLADLLDFALQFDQAKVLLVAL